MVLSSFLLFSCGEGQVIHKDVLDSADIVLTAKEKTMTVGEKYQIQATYVIEEKEAPKEDVFDPMSMVNTLEPDYEEKVGHTIGGSQIYRVLHRNNWRKVMPRSKHPKKAGDEAIEASKKLKTESES